MSAGSPSLTGLSDGPNKKSRLLELIQLPESLDDAMLQRNAATPIQQCLPADEAQHQLGTLQLGSGDELASPVSTAAAPFVRADTAVLVQAPLATDTPMNAEDQTPDAVEVAATMALVSAAASAPTAGHVHAASAARGEKPLIPPAAQREGSLDPAPSDPAVCISYDCVADSSGLEGLGGDEGEGEVASRRTALAGSSGAGEGRAGGFEVFIGGLAPDARDEDVRAALGELAQGEVLSVRLQLTRGMSICKGYGFATFADEAAAQRAVSAAADGVQLCGRRVGLHASRRPFRAVLAAAQAAAAQLPLHLSPEAGASINGLLEILREHPDRRAAVAAALRVMQRGAKRTYPSSAALPLPCANVDNGGGSAAAAAAAAAATTAGSSQRAPAEAKRHATAATVAAASAAVPIKETVPGTPCPPSGSGGDGGQTTAAAGNTTAVAPAAASVPTSVAAPAAAAVEAPAVAGEDAKGTLVVKKETPVEASSAGRGSEAAGGSGAAKAAATAKKASGEKARGGGGAGPPGSGAAAPSTSGGAIGGMSQDLLAALTGYPKILNLLETLKDNARTAKTPVMILHEYAAKMTYEVTYHETSDGPAGPYTVESRLMSGGQKRTTVATASAKARTKKDAKQVSAAALVEKLLDGPRGLSPNDLLPVPKPLGAGAGSTRGGGGKAGSEKNRGAQGNGGGNGRKGPGGRSSGTQAGRFAPLPLPQQQQQQHNAPFYGRDGLNKVGASAPSLKMSPPPPPPSFHGPLMSSRGGGMLYSGGACNLGPIGRGPFSSSGGGGGYSSVQLGLTSGNPSLQQPGGGLGHHGTGVGGGSGASGPLGGLSEGRVGASREHRLGGPSYGDSRNGGGSRGSGGGGGSMVQVGLSSSGGAGGGGGTTTRYGGSYGREDAQGANIRMGLDLNDGSSSYDMAAGHKRNYSTAMQATYGAPAASQGLLPVQPQPAAGAVGSMLGNGVRSQDPFAVQVGGGSRGGPGGGSILGAGIGGSQVVGLQQHQQSVVLGQMQVQPGAFLQQQQQQQQQLAGQPAFGSSQQAQPLFAPTQQQQQLGIVTAAAAAGPPVQQAFSGYRQDQGPPQQQQHLSYGQQPPGGVALASAAAGGGGFGSGSYSGNQIAQLQPVPASQPLFGQQPAQQAMYTPNTYGMGSYTHSQAQQPQQQYASSGMYGNVSQATQGSGYAGGAILQQQQAQGASQSYGMSSTAGLQSYSGVRTGGGLWG
ncbi:hypothetical protein VaNZ11_014105 [Volvox africanus]|uniref:RRM domain-containing protein n=1 Tax=Volvox africanus TaxID=51714 RepID=A0ABQ5SIU2_9CHLO|nr:hypothetical protein VaNZ11_014105 [Volvox africanus]